MSAPSPWRTVLTAVAVVAMQLAAYIVGTRHGWSEQAAHAYDSFCMWSTVAAIGQAGKSAVESLAQGGGVKGAASALLTSAKPGEPPPQATP
jgi:negative regulator of sigma E activity